MGYWTSLNEVSICVVHFVGGWPSVGGRHRALRCLCVARSWRATNTGRNYRLEPDTGESRRNFTIREAASGGSSVGPPTSVGTADYVHGGVRVTGLPGPPLGGITCVQGTDGPGSGRGCEHRHPGWAPWSSR